MGPRLSSSNRSRKVLHTLIIYDIKWWFKSSWRNFDIQLMARVQNLVFRLHIVSILGTLKTVLFSIFLFSLACSGRSCLDVDYLSCAAHFSLVLLISIAAHLFFWPITTWLSLFQLILFCIVWFVNSARLHLFLVSLDCSFGRKCNLYIYTCVCFSFFYIKFYLNFLLWVYGMFIYICAILSDETLILVEFQAENAVLHRLWVSSKCEN